MAGANTISRDIVREMGLGKLSSENQSDILNKISEALLRRIFLETFEKLEENDREKLQEMLESDPKLEEVDAFIQQKVPDYNSCVENIIAEFKKEYKDSLAFAKEM